MKNILSIYIIAFLLGSCNETKQVIDAAGQVQLSGTYTVKVLEGKTITANAPTLTFSVLDKAVNGSTGCNNYFGTYALDLYALTFSEMASTERACDPPIMNTEFVFMAALKNTGSYSLENGMLTLYSSNDRSVLLTALKNKTVEN